MRDFYNSRLANGIGNLTSRIMRMATANIPQAVVEKGDVAELAPSFVEALDTFNIQAAAAHIQIVMTSLDQKIQKEEPFKLVKTDKEQGVAIIADLVKGLYIVSKMLEPFMPETAQKVQDAVLNHVMPEPLFLRKD